MKRSSAFLCLSLFTTLSSTAAMAGARKDRAISAGKAWRDCVNSAATRYASQSETSQALATAAMGRCVSEGAEFRVMLREATREYGLPFASTADQDSIDKTYTKAESMIFQMAVTTIIDARAK